MLHETGLRVRRAAIYIDKEQCLEEVSMLARAFERLETSVKSLLAVFT
jgi:hypothetical protein